MLLATRIVINTGMMAGPLRIVESTLQQMSDGVSSELTTVITPGVLERGHEPRLTR